MDIIIQSPGFKMADTLEGYVRGKVEKLAAHHPRIIRADVLLSNGPAGEPENACCEIRLEIPGYDAFAKKNSTTFEMAVTETIHVLQSQLTKAKEQLAGR